MIVKACEVPINFKIYFFTLIYAHFMLIYVDITDKHIKSIVRNLTITERQIRT